MSATRPAFHRSIGSLLRRARERLGGSRFHRPAERTTGAPHVRSGIDARWVFRAFLVAALPCAGLGSYTAGLAANRAAVASPAPDWRAVALASLGLDLDPRSVTACVAHGLLFLLPLWITALAAGTLWERVFALLRHRPLVPGLGAMALLFVLALPPGMPPWQAALGMSVGVVIGKEVFGGTGLHFVHPVVVGLTFLAFAYPGCLSGASSPEGASAPALIGIAAAGGPAALARNGITWQDALIGLEPSSMGAASDLACLAGAAWLLRLRVISWRVLAGALLGLTATALAIGSAAGSVAIPPHWHLLLGTLSFGLVFLATDPTASASTNPGRWIYGALLGFLVVTLRVANPRHPDGTIAALLLASVFAPLIDHLVARAHVARRRRAMKGSR